VYLGLPLDAEHLRIKVHLSWSATFFILTNYLQRIHSLTSYFHGGRILGRRGEVQFYSLDFGGIVVDETTLH
jgi:hypothetical protein